MADTNPRLIVREGGVLVCGFMKCALSLHGNPAPLLVAAFDGLAHYGISMAIVGRGEQWLWCAGTSYRRINGAKVHFKCVRKPFHVTRGIVHEACGAVPKSRSCANDSLIGLVPVPEAEHLRLLGAPPRRVLRTVEFNPDAIFASRRDLRYAEVSTRPVS